MVVDMRNAAPWVPRQAWKHRRSSSSFLRAALVRRFDCSVRSADVSDGGAHRDCWSKK